MRSTCDILTANIQPPPLGVGVGLRSSHYDHILRSRPPVPWFEAVSENYMGIRGGTGGRPLEMLDRVRADYPVMLHGVSLNIGSTDPLRMDYLKELKALAQRVQPTFVSDHLCWTGVEGENLHDLLPLPFNEETLRHVVSRVRQVQDVLGRRILLENVSSYLTFNNSDMTEWDFLNEVAARSDCGILLDVNNVYVSARNHRFNPLEYIHQVTAGRVGYMHVAGYSEAEDVLIDTHDKPVTEPVWDLYAAAVRRLGDIPSLIEWDENIPPFETLMDEARKAEMIRRQVLGDMSKDLYANANFALSA